MRHRKNVLTEIVIIVVAGAIISFLNTLWLKSILVREIYKANRTYQ